ncbi:MAG: F0F1 ATP synthase subunit gamma [Desulfoplanes sp.]|jgi:F-type H+-transporting ATPase subunit gamma|nr:F0F1 ATP synthase subunit gamma [Desulfoplanes sp.]
MEALKKKIQSAQELFTLVRTMKALAAVNIRQYETALSALRYYFATVETGLQAVLPMRPRGTKKDIQAKQTLGYIVFGSDQGMCGSFNEQIIETARDSIEEAQNHGDLVTVITVGERMAYAFGDELYQAFPLPAQVKGITTSVQEILAAVDTWQQEKKTAKIRILYNQPRRSTGFQTILTQFLPIDEDWFNQVAHKKWPSKQIPLTTMETTILLSRFISQYLFASLHRIFAESLAAENAGRLAAMQAAEKNIEELLGELTGQYNKERQSQITEELLDIIAGFDTIKKNKIITA